MNDPDLIKKIAAEIKSPSIIFLGDGKVIHDDGGSEFVHLDKIVIEYNENKTRVIRVTIPTKNFMQIPPILSSIDGEEYFQEPKRLDAFKWEFKTVELDRIYWNIPDNRTLLGRYKFRDPDIWYFGRHKLHPKLSDVRISEFCPIFKLLGL